MQSKKKKKPNRLMATISDIFSTQDMDDSASLQSNTKSRSYRDGSRPVLTSGLYLPSNHQSRLFASPLSVLTQTPEICRHLDSASDSLQFYIVHQIREHSRG